MLNEIQFHDYYKAENIDLIWKNISAKSRDKDNNEVTILDKCSGKALVGEITAIIGPNGSGKTTLLNVLSGIPDKGITYSGDINLEKVIKDRELFTHSISLVSNKFYFLEHQTLYETIKFALLCYNINMAENILDDKLNTILHLLGLEKNRNELIKKMSVGERKLASIGIAMAENPSVLICDEPFSNVDNTNINRIFRVLRKIADTRKTVIISLNTVTQKILLNCDSIILLAYKYDIFQGSLRKFVEFMKKCDMDVDRTSSISDSIMDLISIDRSSDNAEVVSIQNILNIKNRWSLVKKESRLENKIMYKKIQENWLKKVFIMYKRQIREVRRNTYMMGVMIFQKLFFLVMVCLVYLNVGYSADDVQTRFGLISFLLLNSTERSSSSILTSFEGFKQVYKREIVMGLYNGAECYISNYLYEFTKTFILTSLYIIPVFFISKLNTNFYRFVVFILSHFTLTAFIVAYSVIIGIFTSSPSSAAIIGSLFFIFFYIFGGLFVNIDTIPVFSRWLVWVSPVYYAYEANLQSQMNNQTFYNKDKAISGTEELKKAGLNRISFGYALFSLWGFIIFFFAIGLISMIKKYKPRFSV